MHGAVENPAANMSLSSPTLPNITSKGDLAVFGLGYAAGFVLYSLIIGRSDPPPTTVALVVAIASLAVKSGIEGVLEDESAPISEQERQENLRTKLIAFETLFSEGIRRPYTDGLFIEIAISSAVVVETRWGPNPNYENNDAQGEYEPPYIEQKINEDLAERTFALHALWEAGVVTDEYAEARLSELSDRCCRKAKIFAEVFDPEETGAQSPFFGDRLQALRLAKLMSERELSEASRLSVQIIKELEANKTEPRLSTLRRLADALGEDLVELTNPPPSEGPS